LAAQKPYMRSSGHEAEALATLTLPDEQRRRALRAIVSFAATAGFLSSVCAGSIAAPIRARSIPSSGERLPVIGLGSWVTFNVGDDAPALDRCADVVRDFLESGGRLIDSSPMYGSSEATIGFALRKLGYPKTVFAADKVWNSSRTDGIAQIAETGRRWGIPRFDLLQVHNLDNWQEHLTTLFAMKAANKLGYVGVTTSEGRRTSETEQLLQSQRLDFVQVTYNILDRELDRRLLPLAQDRGIAVIINRPFQRGALIEKFRRYPLPDWAGEIDCQSWPRFLLKFIVSHPAVTCAIPATSNPAHVRENMSAAYGSLPDERMRQRMITYVEAL
jgi:diketogulonate reductase-like aldo/keto reductase